jgi:iron(III) transport system permease protein
VSSAVADGPSGRLAAFAPTTARLGRRLTSDHARTGLVIALVVVLIGIPIAALVGVVLDDGLWALSGALGGPLAMQAIVNSLWTSAVEAVLAVVAGTAAAIVTERAAGRARRWLRAGLVAPLLIPPFVLAFGWTRAFGPHGLTDQLFGVALPGLYGPVGIVLVIATAATPLAWLIVAAALATRVEPELELAARASGAGPLTVFRTITLPLLRSALIGAGIVTFVFGLNSFGVPAVLGSPAGFSTMTTRLYEDLALSSDPASFVRATALAVTLVVIAGIVVGAADTLLVRPPAARSGQPIAGGPVRGGPLATVVLLAVIVAATVIPTIGIVLTALTRAVGLAPIPANWTLDNFVAAVDGRLLGALGRSLGLAAAAATIVLVLAALVVVGSPRPRARLTGTAITLGYAVPGSALAVAILIAYGGLLRDTLAIILVAYLAKFWALGHRQLAGSVERLPADVVRAARASGAVPIIALRTIVAPILRPSITAAWVVVFVFGLHELTMSSLLYGPRTATLAVAVLNVQQLGDPTVTAALAVILMLVVAAAAVPLLVLGRGRARPTVEPTGVAG